MLLINNDVPNRDVNHRPYIKLGKKRIQAKLLNPSTKKKNKGELKKVNIGPFI